MNSNIFNIKYLKKLLIISFVAGILFAILCFIILQAALNAISKPEYCGKTCHEMSSAYESWKRSVHGNNKIGYSVNCEKCHLPPKENNFFRYSAAKIYNSFKNIYKHHFEKYNSKLVRKNIILNMPNSRCICCHNNLIAQKNISDAFAIKAHKAAITRPDLPENRCVRCHTFIGHKRQ